MSLWREVGRLVLALVLAAVALTVLGLGLALVGIDEPGAVARKLLVPMVIAVYLLLTGLRRGEFLRAAAFVPAVRPAQTYLRGFSAGALTLILLNLLLLAIGAREFAPEHGAGYIAYKALAYLFQGLVLVVIEESLFRGLLQGRLERASGTWTAIILGSLLFSAGHFLKARGEAPTDPWENALLAMPDTFAGMSQVPARWLEVIGLFLVGLILAVLRYRTGTIWLGMGVHAGWFWVRSLDDKILEEVDAVVDQHLWIIGTMRYYDGFLGWAALLLTIPVVLILLRPRSEGAP